MKTEAVLDGFISSTLCFFPAPSVSIFRAELPAMILLENYERGIVNT